MENKFFLFSLAAASHGDSYLTTTIQIHDSVWACGLSDSDRKSLPDIISIFLVHLFKFLVAQKAKKSFYLFD